MKTSKHLIIGHRGACGYEPENTPASFRKALELGADMIEMDVYLCKTGEPVIIHDNTLDRTTNGSGYVWDFALNELKKLDAGKGQPIPTLEEALEIIDNMKINLELKGEDTVGPVYNLIRQSIESGKWKDDSFFISSFNHYLLKEFRELMPADSKIKICPLLAGIPVGYAEFAEELDAYSVNLSNEFVNAEFIRDAHGRGMKVFVYTVNSMKEFERIISIGADGIFTDYPDRFRNV